MRAVQGLRIGEILYVTRTQYNAWDNNMPYNVIMSLNFLIDCKKIHVCLCYLNP